MEHLLRYPFLPEERSDGEMGKFIFAPCIAYQFDVRWQGVWVVFEMMQKYFENVRGIVVWSDRFDELEDGFHVTMMAA